ncbi:transmembrane 9 family protein [Streptomyces sp. SLBN-118]|uniref:transmembrane 9 family protein n=1 Tax=Streptomyces sp. SLBN-118 TaxID=2768454 RepID=UPI00114D4F3F|nr:transmembrane 9 family protein [Streptomyces sp. SLBN-118]
MSQVLRTPVARLLFSVLIGAATGFALFGVTRLSGRDLFVVTGGIAGAASVLMFQVYGRAARLTEVTVTVPQFSQLTFMVNDESRQVAWRLFVETVTRVSTQPLKQDDGLVRETLTSLYGLFATTREALKAGRPSVPLSGGPTVEYLAITMLNRELRPFLSKWHPRLLAYEKAAPDGPESAWPDDADCRAELRTVQTNLRSYALGFARLAGVKEPQLLIDSAP